MLAFLAGLLGITLLLWAEWAQARAATAQSTAGRVFPIGLIRGVGIAMALFSILLLFFLLYGA